MTPEDIRGFRWIVWRDYGSEGWHPTPFDEEGDAIRFALNSTERCVITSGVVEFTIVPFATD